MSKSRNNHYVPQWYQCGFLEPGQSKLAYLDLTPDEIALSDGRRFTERARFSSSPSQCFRKQDLYSTFFGVSVNDEIERRLFGALDAKGADAVRAFMGADPSLWVEHFETLFAYIDMQRLRTPKGLAWLKLQYPSLDQNELMEEMQAIRMMNCTMWSQGVREIVSAEDAEVKFIVTDHPVTIYNYATPPGDPVCSYPNDPGMALKASQTLFPLSRDFCLILTHLEYAQDQDTNPLQKRTFARNFRDTIVRGDALIRDRKLTSAEVTRINFIMKKRARRYLSAGKQEWLYPERSIDGSWSEIRDTLLPPENGLWHFGGEMYVSYEDGRVHYQDAYGRTEKPWGFLQKTTDEKALRPGDACGCGSGRRFKHCCQSKPLHLRPSWSEPSIRERNLFLYRAVVKELELETKSWVDVRRALTDEQIARLYSVFAALWPTETDLLQLLPKPDGEPRAVYTGPIHPDTLTDFAMGAPVYFGQVLIEHPFVHARVLNNDFSPIENPKSYRQEFLKTVVFLLAVMPLVDAGLINLVPDPCNFDPHLRDQMHRLARRRMAGIKIDSEKDPRLKELMRDDSKRSMLALPEDSLRALIQKSHPTVTDAQVETAMRGSQILREDDPLAVLQDGTFDGGKEGGILSLHKVAPNFEMAMYLAQATGAVIITDNAHRWEEVQRAMRWRLDRPTTALPVLLSKIEAA